MLLLKSEQDDFPDFSLEKGRISIGRHPDNDIVLPSKWVSAFHAEIIHTHDGKTFLVDFGSRNGSYVNGLKVEGRIELAPDSTVYINDSKIKISSSAFTQQTLSKNSARIPSKPQAQNSNVSAKQALLENHQKLAEPVPAEPKLKLAEPMPARPKQKKFPQPHPQQQRRREPYIGLSLSSGFKNEHDFPSLAILTGKAAGACFDIPGKILLGRAATNDIVLEDRTVSGRHALIDRDAEQDWIIKDLGSANGVRVNGVHVTTAKLKTGDKLTLGRVELVYRYPGRVTEFSRKQTRFFAKSRERAIPYFRPLLAKIMEAARNMVGAELGTLFLPDANSKELWSCIIQDHKVAEIRIADNKGS
jgi:pSer/pThr/pTyr-binding forkhead associated (FHA) protein